MDKQPRRHRNVYCCIFADGARGHCVCEIRHQHPQGGFSDSPESALCFEFVRRDLFWPSRPRTGIHYGRRNRKSAEDIARRGGLGRRVVWLPVYRCDANIAGGGGQEQHQRVAGNCASREPHGRTGWRFVDGAPFAFLLSVSIAGIGSAWLGGSARIPFVAGLDSYMPEWLGKIHPKYGTPYAALMVHAIVSLILVILNFVATGGVQESF